MWDLLNAFDFAIIRWLNGFAGANDYVDYVAWKITGLDIIKGGVVVGLLWGVWTIERPGRDTNTDIIRALLGIVFAVFVGRLLQLLLPFRVRPLHEPLLDFQLLENVPITKLEGWSSFPSDHGVLYGAIAIAILYRSRIVGIFALTWVLVAILLPRVYIGFHYPLDAIVGIALGAILMASVMALPVPVLAKVSMEQLRTRYSVLYQTLVFLFLFEAASLFDGTRLIVVNLGYYFGFKL